MIERSHDWSAGRHCADNGKRGGRRVVELRTGPTRAGGTERFGAARRAMITIAAAIAVIARPIEVYQHMGKRRFMPPEPSCAVALFGVWYQHRLKELEELDAV